MCSLARAAGPDRERRNDSDKIILFFIANPHAFIVLEPESSSIRLHGHDGRRRLLRAAHELALGAVTRFEILAFHQLALLCLFRLTDRALFEPATTHKDPFARRLETRRDEREVVN